MCQKGSTRKGHAFEYNVSTMRKDTALSFRVPRRLKAELQKVALAEGRSLAQVCEALLAGASRFTGWRGLNPFNGCFLGRKKNPPTNCGFTPPITPRTAQAYASVAYEFSSSRLRGREHHEEVTANCWMGWRCKADSSPDPE